MPKHMLEIVGDTWGSAVHYWPVIPINLEETGPRQHC